MAIIKLKRRASPGAAGAPSSLASGEPAYNETDDTLYIGTGDNGSGVATAIKPIAGAGKFVDKTSDQTIGGTKTFSTVPDVGTMATSDNSTKAASTAFVKANIPAQVTYTGTTGRITITGTVVDIASNYTGQNTITTLGTIATGTWNATTIAANKGGTGQSSYAIGDLLYASSTTALAKLGIGAAGNFLTVTGGVPVWTDTVDGGTY